ncbi:MAG: Yip1 family protein [Candidatus Cyclobacteriaceae bacterium M3_2C_046]
MIRRQLLIRLKNVLLHPGREWNRIRQENPDYTILLTYAASWSGLAAAIWLVRTILEEDINFDEVFQVVSAFISPLLTVIFTGYVIFLTARSFQSQTHLLRSFQLATYAFSPYFVANILMQLFPANQYLFFLSLYGLYIYWLGLGKLLYTPWDRKIPFMIITIFVVFVFWLIFGFLLSLIFNGIFY